jgi:very-short-patch-repair endonuclease
MKEKMILLRDRLNDLSRRNRSIRMLTISDKWTFDLNDIKQLDLEPAAYIDALMNGKSKVIVKQDTNDDEALVLSKKLTSLYRNIKAIEEETGLYDLYLGYPFFDGVMRDGTYVRAPLFLYPVRLNRLKKHGIEWEVSPEEGGPQLNRSLLLALQKFSSLHVSDSIFDEAEEKVGNLDLDGLVDWLDTHDIQTVLTESAEIEKIPDYTMKNLPDLEKGKFRLLRHAILGHLPQGNSAILKDYEKFLTMLSEENSDFGIVQELLGVSNKEDSSHITDNLLDGADDTLEERLKREKNKFLVLDSDASQERIIDSIETERGMVVHGPPGSGKSQVIVNMIANSMAKKQKVMLVTQKRAALDVVYQRMDSIGLSSNIVLLHDENNDRNAFYQKLNQLLASNHSFTELQDRFDDVSAKIAQTENELNIMARGLFEVQSHGYRAYDLYGIGKTAKEQEEIVNLSMVIDELNRYNLEDVLMKVLSYGRFHSRFGAEDYPLKNRKSFSNLEIKDRVKFIESLDKIIRDAEESSQHLSHFKNDNITPEYSWNVEGRIEKIYEDLTSKEKKTLQKLRLWIWTTFTGKTIIEELLAGNKFKGTDSEEWPKLKRSITILYDLAKVSEKMSKQVYSMKDFLSDDQVDHFRKRIAQGDFPLELFQQQLNFMKKDFEDLRDMDRVFDEGTNAVKAIIDQLKQKDISNNLEERWRQIAEQSAYIHWIDQLERKHPALSKIGTADYKHLNDQLKTLLEKKQELSIELLRNQMKKAVNEVRMRNSKSMKDIEYQTGKKRMVWPVRKLVNEYAVDGLLDVMPVWLVSPEMASAIFPLKENIFDLVIFDEASQCTVENGLPAIYRGRKVVVAGDEKQLPPSALFKGSVQLDEDEALDKFEESESLLSLAKRVLPNSLLEWHYRSKSEELINFSNHAYYNGRIQIAPNVNHMQQPAAIQWHKTDGRWINQQNTVEAKAVVQLLKAKLIADISKSVGIITFNAKQQSAIEDEIDRIAEADTEFSVVYDQVMSRDMDERVFVKNIENVQGDERDIIIFSVAYAKNEEGRVYSNFGSLSHQGGENHLNVAVTRAKEEIHLVSSIEPYELNVTNSKNDGPRHLKAYLEYAQAVSDHNKDSIQSVISNLNEEANTKRQVEDLHFDSPFEEAVYSRLTAIGYKIDTQVGMSGYRIDMAVVHPEKPHRYIIGIECDGAMYHSAPEARERDIYRQRFLESRKWKITRIWSRSWWKDANSEIERVDQLIKSMLREKH